MGWAKAPLEADLSGYPASLFPVQQARVTVTDDTCQVDGKQKRVQSTALRCRDPRGTKQLIERTAGSGKTEESAQRASLRKALGGRTANSQTGQNRRMAWCRESRFLGRLIRCQGSPSRREESGALKKEIGVSNSQGEGMDKCLGCCCFFSSLHSLVLVT